MMYVLFWYCMLPFSPALFPRCCVAYNVVACYNALM